MAGLLLCVDSLLNRCYLLVSGSVSVRRVVVGRLGLGLGLGLVLVLRLGLVDRWLLIPRPQPACGGVVSNIN